MPNDAPLSPGEVIAQRTITAYTLTPAQLRKSEGLHRTNVVLSLTSTVFGLSVLLCSSPCALAQKSSAWLRQSPGNALCRR